MYAKIFRQIYDGTLAEDWRALVTFQQLLILSDDRGVIDMTPGAIHRVTGIPMDIIEPGLKKLQEPDPHSRSATEDGRRIVPVDPTRPWGWRIINFVYYRNLASLEEKREKDRQRIADKRKKINGSDDCREVSQPVAECRAPSEGVANVAHTDTDTDTDTEQDLKPIGASAPTRKAEYPPEFETAWSNFPPRSGDNPKRPAFQTWSARRKEGHTPEELTQGVMRYAAYCKATEKTETEFVMQTKRFFGPDKPFLQPWTVTKPGAKHEQFSDRKYTGTDLNDVDWLKPGNA